ncbi:hypothetical protein [Microbulbifer halophilus]|uniref:Polysaccharide deacetylase n=2 Tax=Microbulbifer halophilus TaxID=453963 RepID=A0ABW5EJ53_9GAMM|nr:hypothetical protein [Microbulbifer halophilus]MCW8128329.1 hypothetical protein [Microbulbifer halophilus]
MKSLRVLLRQTMAVALLSLPLESFAGDDRRIALTLDDKPPSGTPGELLDELERLRIKATLLPARSELAESPAAIDADGVDGSRAGRVELARPTARREIDGAAKILRQLAHRDPLALHPPYAQIPRLQQRDPGGDDTFPAHWQQPPEADSGLDDPQEIADYIADNAFPGAVVLMHPMRGQRDQVLKTLPLISEKLRGRGYDFATLSEVIGDRRKRESEAMET